MSDRTRGRSPQQSPADPASAQASAPTQTPDQASLGNSEVQQRVRTPPADPGAPPAGPPGAPPMSQSVAPQSTGPEAAASGPPSAAPAAAADPVMAFQSAVAAGNGAEAQTQWALVPQGARNTLLGDSGLMVAYFRLIPAATAAALARSAPVDTQHAVASNATLATSIVGGAGTYVLQVLPLLRGDPRLVTLAANAGFFTLLFADVAALGGVIAGSGAAIGQWLAILQGQSKFAEILRWAASNAGVWAPAVKAASLFDTILNSQPSPVAADLAPGVWALWENQGYARASTMLAFQKLYNASIQGGGSTFTVPGSNVTNVNGTFQIENRAPLVDVDDASLNDFMRMVKPLPRNNVSAAPIGFAGTSEVWAKQIALPPGSPGAPANTWFMHSSSPLFTSFYTFAGQVLIRAVNTAAAGAAPAWSANANRPGVAFEPGRAVGNVAGASEAVGDDGHGGTLSVFQNHARHEIGHAVGAKNLPGIGSGNQMARDWGGWAVSDSGQLADAYWPSPSGDASVTCKGTTTSYAQTALKAWCKAVVENGSGPAGNPITTHAGGDTGGMLDAISTAVSSQNLSKYAKVVITRGPGEAYVLDGIPNPPDRVHIRCTRSIAPFMSYAKTAFTSLKATHGWYSMASPVEMFAEMYTLKYSAGLLPGAGQGGVNPADWFRGMEAMPDAVFGAAAVEAGLRGGQMGNAGAGEEADTAAAASPDAVAPAMPSPPGPPGDIPAPPIGRPMGG